MATQANASVDVFDIGSEEEEDTVLTLILDNEKLELVIEPDQVLMNMMRPLPGMQIGHYPASWENPQHFIVYA